MSLKTSHAMLMIAWTSLTYLEIEMIGIKWSHHKPLICLAILIVMRSWMHSEHWMNKWNRIYRLKINKFYNWLEKKIRIWRRQMRELTFWCSKICQNLKSIKQIVLLSLLWLGVQHHQGLELVDLLLLEVAQEHQVELPALPILICPEAIHQVHQEP
jgi:hypothetical protein